MANCPSSSKCFQLKRPCPSRHTRTRYSIRVVHGGQVREELKSQDSVQLTSGFTSLPMPGSSPELNLSLTTPSLALQGLLPVTHVATKSKWIIDQPVPRQLLHHCSWLPSATPSPANSYLNSFSFYGLSEFTFQGHSSYPSHGLNSTPVVFLPKPVCES